MLNVQIQCRKVVEFEFVPWMFSDDIGLIKLDSWQSMKLLNKQLMLSKCFSHNNYEQWFHLYNSRAPKSIWTQVFRKFKSKILGSNIA